MHCLLLRNNIVEKKGTNLIQIICSLAFFSLTYANLQKSINTLGAGILPADTQNVTVLSGGLTRDYIISIPKTYTAGSPTPLIFAFHGRGKDAKYQQELTQLSNSSFNPHAIVAYPNGFMNKRGTRQFQGDPDAIANVNDVQFTLDMITQISTKYMIDKKRIFAVGKSNGGTLVNLLACDPAASAVIAAFGFVSGAFYLQPNGSLPLCNPSRFPIPIINFHGWVDKTVLYDGGENTRGIRKTASIPQWLNGWAVKDGCAPSSNQRATLCDKENPVTRYMWSCHGIQEAIVHYNISNLGHVWPKTAAKVHTCFDATTVSMDFFSKHSLP